MPTAVLCISATAWLLLLTGSARLAIPVGCASSANWGGPTLSALDLALALNPPVAASVHWALMIAAMMGPLLSPPLARAAQHGVHQTLSFLGGYLAVWMATGPALTFIALVVLIQAVDRATVVVCAVLIAVIWQLCPARRRCLDGCGAAPCGDTARRLASRKPFRAGLRHGLWCAGSCWALMLLTLLAPGGHWTGMTAMAVASLWLLGERRGWPAMVSRRWRSPGGAPHLAVQSSCGRAHTVR